MTKKEVKEYLQQYRSSMARFYRLGLDMERTAVGTAALRKEMEECINHSSRIEKLIAEHGDLTEREVLTRKYIYGDTIEAIAETMSYSPRHIRRMLDKAAETLGQGIDLS